jgi:hypothetical protein
MERPANREVRAVAWVTWAFAIVTAVLGTAYGYAEQASALSPIEQTTLSYVAGSAVAVVYGSVGLVLAVRRPRLVVGWLFLATGFVAGLADMSWAYSLLAATRGTAPGPMDGATAAWLANGLLPPIWFVIAIALILVFPNGRLISARWNRAVDALVVLGLLLAAALALRPGALVFYPFIENPRAAGGPLGTAAALLTPLILGALVVLGFAAAWSMRRRYVYAGPVEREQLKWFGWASVLLVTAAAIQVIVGVAFATPGGRLADLAWLLFTLAAITVPIAALIAITRYRLYDIDRLIGRTFVYGTLTAILAGVYAASIRLFTALFIEVTGESSDAALVLTTLVLATSFTPIKQRLETLAGERYSPKGASATLPEPAAFDDRVAEIARRVAREVMSEERRTP